MRWFLVILAAVLGVWITYVVSPYWSVYRLGRAVQQGDVAAMTARVNVSAVKLSLARQIAGDLAAQEGSGVATADAQRTAAAAIGMAEPYLQEFLTPEGLLRLLRTGSSGEGGSGSPFSGGDAVVSLDDLDDFLSVSNWRGFRNVYVNMPPEASQDERFRLQMRFSALTWRLISVELPQRFRRRIIERVAGRAPR